MSKNVIHNFRNLSFSKRLICIIMSGSLAIVPFISFADVSCPPGTLCNPLKTQTFADLISAVLDVIIRLGTPIAVLFLVYAGFMFVSSRGDTKKLDTAKSMFWWTVIGTALVLGARLIMAVLQNTITGITG